MSDKITTTTPSFKALQGKDLEEYNKKLEKAANKKTEKSDSKKAQKEAVKKQKQDEATAIFKAATANIKAENYYSFNEYKQACEDAFNKNVEARKATADTSDDLSPEQIKLAKEYMKSQEFKAVKTDIEDQAYNRVRGIAGDVDGVKKGERKKETDAEIKRMLDNGEISQQEYDALKKANKTTTAFQRFFGKKAKTADRIHTVGARRENLEKTREFMTSYKEGAAESRISPELMAKVEAAGYSMDDLYRIYDDNSGTDATVNYSYKPKQEGERDQILASLNSNLPENAQEFTMSDVKHIGRALGYNVEKAVDGGKVMRDVGRATPIAGALAPIMTKAHSMVTTASTVAEATSVVPVGAIVGGVTLAATAAGSAYQQYHRVEDRAIPTDVPFGVETLEEYSKYLDNQATKEGARLGKGIAKHFVNPYTGKLDYFQMGRALSKAAGTEETISTPCNYEEAEALLTDLESGKIKPKFTKPVENVEKPKVTQEVVVKTETPEEIEKIKVTTYTIKRGDNPWEIAKGIYGDGKYYKEVQKMIPDGAKFWNIGTEVNFGPITLEDGTVIEPKENPTVKQGEVSSDYTGKSTKNTQYVPRQRVTKEKTYGADAYNVDGNGNRSFKQNVTNGHTNVDERNNKVDDYKKKNESENHVVTVQ